MPHADDGVLDRALDALADGCRTAGVAVWEPPASTETIETVGRAIAPFRLPADLRAFWTRVDPVTVKVAPYPRLIDPGFAIRSRSAVGDPFQPTIFLDVGYESHGTMSVELEIGDYPGGALFEWFVSDTSEFARRYNRFADWLQQIAEGVHRGAYSRLEHRDGPYLLLDELRHPPPEPHPVHGTAIAVDGDIVKWPEHWRLANGLRPIDVEPRGATHTIADALSQTGSAWATVLGRVMTLVGSGLSTHVRVADASGEMTIHCPPGTTLLGPVIDRWYEFDVELLAHRRAPTDTETRSLPADADDEARTVAAFVDRYAQPANAVATAVRRVTTPAA